MKSLVAVIFAIVCIAAVPRERTLEDHFDDLLGSMQVDDGTQASARVRGEAYSEMRRAHERLVRHLAEIVKTEKAEYAYIHEPRVSAVHLLMQYRSPEALPVFVRYVDWEHRLPAAGGDLLSPIPNHPCAVALSAYGAEAVPEIYKRLQQAEPPPSDKAIELYAWIIVGALGDNAVRAVETRAGRALGNKNFSLLLDKVKEVAEIRRPKARNREGGDPIPATEAHTLQDHFDELLTTMQFDDGSLESERVRKQAHDELQISNRHLMRQLIKIVETEKESYDRHLTDSRFLAVHFLGRMHYPEAVRAFVKHVDWEYKLPNRDRVGALPKGSPISDYPCAVMLRSRGASTFYEIFNTLERYPRPSDKAIELYAWIILESYEDLAGDQEAVQVVDMRANRSENNKNLLLLLDKVKEIVEQRAQAR